MDEIVPCIQCGRNILDHYFVIVSDDKERNWCGGCAATELGKLTFLSSMRYNSQFLGVKK